MGSRLDERKNHTVGEKSLRCRGAGRGKHRRTRRNRGFRVSVQVTVLTSLVNAGLGALAGVIISRYLGPSGRGTYAAINSYVFMAAIIGECGISAAICYFVAQDPAGARDVMRTGAILLLGLGTLVGVVGILVAPLLFDGATAVAAARCVFAAEPLILASASWVFALQACRIRIWNVVCTLQPAIYLLAIASLAAIGLLDVKWALYFLIISVGLQTITAAVLCRRAIPGRGRLRGRTARDLFGYGFPTLLSSVCYQANARLDVLVLALLVKPSALGQYSVAVSLGALPLTITGALGKVAMPRLAAQRAVGAASSAEAAVAGSARRLVTAAVGASLAIGLVMVTAISALATIAVPRIYGPDFAESIRLFWLLAPGVVLLACNRTIDDVLRGLGRPLVVARCEGFGTVLTVILLATLVPAFGVAAAAVTSSVAYAASFLLLVRAVLRAVDLSVTAAIGRLYRLVVTNVGQALSVGSSDIQEGNVP